MEQNTARQLESSANLISPEEYQRKRADIQRARVYLQQMEGQNEAERVKYEASLLDKIREGEEARQRLIDLQRHRDLTNGPLAIEPAPSSARIEEISATSPQPRSSLHTSHLASSQAPSVVHSRPPPFPSHHNSLPRPQQYYPYSSMYPYSHLPQTQNLPMPHVSNSMPVHWGPQTQNSRMPLTSNSMPIHREPQNYHRMQNIGHQQQVLHHPTATRPPATRAPVLSESTSIHGSSAGSQAQSNGVQNKFRVSIPPINSQPGAQSVGSSSLSGALGPQIPPSSQPLDPTKSGSSVPGSTPKDAQFSAPNLQLPPTPTVPDDELLNRKLKILNFRRSILDWAKASQPNTYTEFSNIKVNKDQNSIIRITSGSKGREATEVQEAFFKRLWTSAGLSLESFPSEGEPQPASTTITAGLPTPSNALSALKAPVPVSQVLQTPQRRTLVDPSTGTWRSPADADKKRLARDVIQALGKRKQDSTSLGPSKRQALAGSSASALSSAQKAIPSTALATKPQIQIDLTTQHPAVAEVSSVVPSSTESLEQATDPTKWPAIANPPANLNPPTTLTHPPPTIVTPPDQIESVRTSPGQSKTQETQTSSDSSVLSLQSRGPVNSAIPLPENLQSEGVPTGPSQDSPISSSQVFVPPPSKISHDLGKSTPTTPVAEIPIVVTNVPTPPEDLMIQKDKVETQISHAAQMTMAISGTLDNSQTSQATPGPVQVAHSERNVSMLLPRDDTNVVGSSGLDLHEDGPISKAQEPLFLPSPSLSPSPPPKQRVRLPSVYVLVPPPPEYLVRHRRRQLMRDDMSDFGKDGIGASSDMSTSRTSRRMEDSSFRFESSNDPHERDAFQLSCSRLQKQRCRWGECDIKLNSVDALVRHLNCKHKPAGVSFFICRWTQCGKQCRFNEKHLEKHATTALQCAYEGCTDSYRTSGQLLKHFRTKHANGTLKAPARPFHPELQSPTPLPDNILPYFLVTPPVMPTAISAEEQSVLEPWVIRRVVGFDGDGPNRRRRSNNSDSVETTNTYEYLNMRSTRYSWIQSAPVDLDFDDLDSEEISKECQQGLTLFGKEDSETDDDRELSDQPLFSSPLLPNVQVEASPSSEPVSDEEQAVHNLLIE